MIFNDLDEIKTSLEWMKNNAENGDDDDFIENMINHWDKSYPYRCSKEHLDDTFDDIVNEFRFLKRPYGFALVSL